VNGKKGVAVRSPPPLGRKGRKREEEERKSSRLYIFLPHLERVLRRAAERRCPLRGVGRGGLCGVGEQEKERERGGGRDEKKLTRERWGGEARRSNVVGCSKKTKKGENENERTSPSAREAHLVPFIAARSTGGEGRAVRPCECLPPEPKRERERRQKEIMNDKKGTPSSSSRLFFFPHNVFPPQVSRSPRRHLSKACILHERGAFSRQRTFLSRFSRAHTSLSLRMHRGRCRSPLLLLLLGSAAPAKL